MKKSYIAGFAVSIVLLYFVFRKADIGQTLQILGSTNLLYILLMLFLLVPVLLLRSIRWKNMFSEPGEVRTSNFFESTCIGIMVNNLLPFRGGDFAQMFFLKYKTGISNSTVFSTILMERLCDFIATCVVLICGSFFVLLPEELPREKVAVVLALLVAGTFMLVKSKKITEYVLHRALPEGWLKGKLARLLENFHAGLSFMGRKHILTRVAFYTALIWLLSGAVVCLGLRSIGIGLNLLSGTFLVSMMGLAAMVPSSPGYVGPLEFVITAGLGIFGVDRSHIVSFIIIYRLISWLPYTLLGLVILFKNHLTLGFLSKLSGNYPEQNKV